MTKHGALGFAEWLALNYGHRGIRVSCLCPNAVYTGRLRPPGDESTAAPDGGALGEVLMPERRSYRGHFGDSPRGDCPRVRRPAAADAHRDVCRRDACRCRCLPP